jgi:hypothetical protein
MKMRFKTEKHAREETIGRAVTMAQVAVREQREFNEREQRKVDALLRAAVALELGEEFPRDARGLVAMVEKPKRTSKRKPLNKGNEDAGNCE